MFKSLFSLFFIVSMGACGVKGKPLPPLKPRELGIGKPVSPAVDKETGTEIGKEVTKDPKKDKETP